MRRGAFPGSFNPPTVAHLELARVARRDRELDRVDLVVSRVALNKEQVERPTLAHRVEVLERLAARVGWLGVVVSDHQLVVDLVAGYEVAIMGADKWAQLSDVRYYDDEAHMRDALNRLPDLAIAGRADADHVQIPPAWHLDLDSTMGAVSSTEARRGRHHLMVPEAVEFDRQSGAWTDPDRYLGFLARDDVPGGHD